MRSTRPGPIREPATLASLDALLAGLKAAGEATRLRLIALLARGDLTVKDLTAILMQSQPRISRHLKLLTEAGLVRRFPEGAWAYYRVADEGPGAAIARSILDRFDPNDPVLARDAERHEQVKRAHAEAAARYFARNAARWDELRSLYVAEDEVEGRMRAIVGEKPVRAMLDLGTGTGRMLELFSDLYDRGVGIDSSHDMLAVARMNLDRAGIHHAQVRYGDILDLGTHLGTNGRFDLVILHQVLHYLDEPARAIAEAARVLAPQGRLLVVDFAPHDLEFLRENHAHRRLGLAQGQVQAWIAEAGLKCEEFVALTPPAGRSEKLTVQLWLARDERVLTDPSPHTLSTVA